MTGVRISRKSQAETLGGMLDPHPLGALADGRKQEVAENHNILCVAVDTGEMLCYGQSKHDSSTGHSSRLGATSLKEQALCNQ